MHKMKQNIFSLKNSLHKYSSYYSIGGKENLKNQQKTIKKPKQPNQTKPNNSKKKEISKSFHEFLVFGMQRNEGQKKKDKTNAAI